MSIVILKCDLFLVKYFQDEFDRMKDDLNGQMVKLREEYANRVTELEKQLDSAHGNRMSSMFQMKEEVLWRTYLLLDILCLQL